MKKLYFLAVALLLTAFSYGQAVFINEIHYDNAGSDVDEAIEIAGPAGTNLSTYSLVAYNGSNGGEYNTLTLSGVISDQDNGYGTLYFPFTGLQNGAPDGIALVDGATVIQFLSYEGSFTAVDGVANGMTSTDIGVAEIGTDAGESLQLGGAGTDYTNFTWQESMAHTMGAVNTNQDFGGTPMPSLAITSPADGSTLSPEASVSLDITFTVSNFTVANGSGDGHIHYTVDGGSNIMKYDTDPITLTGLSAGSHTIYMELVDNSHNVLSPEVNTTVTFTIAAYTDVANLAALRAGTEGEYYRVTGQVVTTYTQTYRKQKWVQDASAGVKIDDNSAVITTEFAIGDAMINLKGKLNIFNGLIQLIPTADMAVASSNNPITPVAVSLSDLAANLGDYESELILISAATIADWDDGGSGDADGTFQTGKNYPLTDASDTGNLRTNFYGADYIGTALPTISRDYVCIVGNYNGDAQVTPRDASDILGVNKMNTIDSFSLYPNPVTNGVITITTKDNLSKNIQIFDILGKQVFAQTTPKTSIDISSIKRGIYIIKVEEAGHFATRKLVVK